MAPPAAPRENGAHVVAIGKALFGNAWKVRLAPLLNVSVRTLRNWEVGDFGVSHEMLERVRDLARERIEVLRQLVEGMPAAKSAPDVLPSEVVPGPAPDERQAFTKPVIHVEPLDGTDPPAALPHRPDDLKPLAAMGRAPHQPLDRGPTSRSMPPCEGRPESNSAEQAPGSPYLNPERSGRLVPIDGDLLAAALISRLEACPHGENARRWMQRTPDIAGREAWEYGERRSIRVALSPGKKSIRVGFYTKVKERVGSQMRWYDISNMHDREGLNDYLWIPPESF